MILFVPDGLRACMVSEQMAPTFWSIMQGGVAFPNSHSLFPTFTTPNASAMSTGHYLGDTGDFSNTLFTKVTIPSAQTVTPFLENDQVLGDMDTRFRGDYLNEITMIRAAREKGYSTAVVGKLGPTLIWDHTCRTGSPTIVVDDLTAPAPLDYELMKGIPLSAEMKAALRDANICEQATDRGENKLPGTIFFNKDQQNYFVNVTTKAILPLFARHKKPFFLVFWSRDPDGSQHNQGDSPDTMIPGINGPTSLAAIGNADSDLKQIQKALVDNGLDKSTDIIVSADHGFGTISKLSNTSSALEGPPNHRELPVGFVAIDLAKALNLPLFDPDKGNAPVTSGHPSGGNGLIGKDPLNPDVVVAANGGSDLIYVPTKDWGMMQKVVRALTEQDYVSGLFVDDKDFGSIPGTLTLSDIGLQGTAITPRPTIVVNFRSFVTNTAPDENPLKWTGIVADTTLLQGQGQHGGFSRAETQNFMAAIGPDFKTQFIDPAPVSNSDVGQTIARLLRLEVPHHGGLLGRVIEEAFPGGEIPKFMAGEKTSTTTESGLQTVLEFQRVGDTPYFDLAGFRGRTVGLDRQ